MTKRFEGSVEASRRLGLRHRVELSDQGSSLWLLLVHGRSGSFDSMWSFRRCAPSSWSVVAVEAPYDDPQGGYSWWPDFGEDPLPDRVVEARVLLKSFLKSAPEYYEIGGGGVVAYGFSQGAIILSDLIQCETTNLVGVALLAGCVVESRCAPPANGPQTQTRVFMGHGEQDQVLPFERSLRGREHLSRAGFSVEFVSDPVGHRIGINATRALTAWTTQFVSKS